MKRNIDWYIVFLVLTIVSAIAFIILINFDFLFALLTFILMVFSICGTFGFRGFHNATVAENKLNELVSEYQNVAIGIPNVTLSDYISTIEGKKFICYLSAGRTYSAEFTKYWLMTPSFDSIHYDKLIDVNIGSVSGLDLPLVSIVISYYTLDVDKKISTFYKTSREVRFDIKHIEEFKEFYRTIKIITALSVAKRERYEQKEHEIYTSSFYKGLKNAKDTFVFDKNNQLENAPILRNSLEDMPQISIARVTSNFDDASLVSFVVIGIQTTGDYVTSGDEIVELNAVKFIDGEISEKFTTLIRPLKKGFDFSSIKEDITKDEINSLPTIDQVRSSFIAFVGSCNLVGYEIINSLKFLYAYGFNELFKGKRKYFNVIKYVRSLFKYPDDEDLSLKSICNHYKILWDDESGLSATYATGQLLLTVVDVLTEVHNDEI